MSFLNINLTTQHWNQERKNEQLRKVVHYLSVSEVNHWWWQMFTNKQTISGQPPTVWPPLHACLHGCHCQSRCPGKPYQRSSQLSPFAVLLYRPLPQLRVLKVHSPKSCQPPFSPPVMRGEFGTRVRYIKTGFFPSRRNVPFTGLFIICNCTLVGKIYFKVWRIRNTPKLRCYLSPAFEYSQWEIVSFKSFDVPLQISQVSHSLCLDGPSLSWNAFYFLLLVPSCFICWTSIYIC